MINLGVGQTIHGRSTTHNTVYTITGAVTVGKVTTTGVLAQGFFYGDKLLYTSTGNTTITSINMTAIGDTTVSIYANGVNNINLLFSAQLPAGYQLSYSENGWEVASETGRTFNTILYGAGAPTDDGIDGDFYIDTDANEIYGPKNSVWGTGNSLEGPAGPQGAAGPAGSTGPQGDPGDPTDTWMYYAITWSSTPAFLETITGGDVYVYTLDAVTRYRFVPSPYDSEDDAFYSTFTTPNLSGLIATRG